MASRWVKSLHCKSRAFEDVNQTYSRGLLPRSSGCRKSSQTLKDVADITVQKAKKPMAGGDQPPKQSSSSDMKGSKTEPPGRVNTARQLTHGSHHDTVFPVLTELPEGHPSRNVVEIIFRTGWGSKAFSGHVEIVFKVQNGPRAVARFEEYRGAVKSSAAVSSMHGGYRGDTNARCAADGNEVMRFLCMGGYCSEEHDDDKKPYVWWTLSGGGASICTYSGSGQAHCGAGGGRGRRAMLVCRVISGRVGSEPFIEDRGGYDSVRGDHGELVVFDSRAVLPCFLIFYRL
ncbi:hypothetical protein SAY87_011530 [Trapa incisa]|uniref:Uncharacterized protein n=1 Tax=Trapa incisa TaxID=236973 RepID=A0AAN7GQX9_9MYRT|nr:hypothetical protein SAY87_011530 [Trapa incisa]